jgi:hypothetical protein
MACHAVSLENWGVQYSEEKEDEAKGSLSWSAPTWINGLSRLAAEMLFCKAILDGAVVRRVR